jgi:predicted Zn-dependent protease
LDATNADLIHKKKSYLSNFYKNKVFSNNLNIIENPKLDYFTGSKTIDHEGFKTSKKKIIENGIFKKIIYNQENAIKYNKKPTGNGINNETEYTNIFLKPGKQSINNIIKNTKKGLLVYTILGMHSSNITNGEFSTNISNAVEIENGELKKSVTNLSFSGNMKEIFKKVSFSKEQKFIGNGLIPFSKFSKVKLI